MDGPLSALAGSDRRSRSTLWALRCDVDNAVLSVRFEGGSIGTLTASRTTRYGHEIRGEVIGEEGAVQIGRLRKTPVRLLDRYGVHHDAVFTTPDQSDTGSTRLMPTGVMCFFRTLSM